MKKLFEGLTVLEFCSNIAGPMITTQMADYGATVIKVERPYTGDDSRSWDPTGGGVGGDPLGFTDCNRNKKSIEVDLKDPRGIVLVKELVKEADVLVEATRPGVMKRLGLDYETLHQLNPRLIYASISCFGQSGPYSQLPGYDLIAQACSGLIEITGDPEGPPTKIGTEIGDYCGALGAFGSVNAALYYREKTGVGIQVDVSLARILLWLSFRSDENQTRQGNLHGQLSPYGIYNRSRAEGIVIATANQKMWKRLCTAIGDPTLYTDPRFLNNALRCEHNKELRDYIEEWMRTQDSIEEVFRKCNEAGVPTCRIYNQADVRKDPHFLECGWVTEVPVSKKSQQAYGVSKKLSMPTPFHFCGLDPEYKATPSLGDANVDVMESVGYTKEQAEAIEYEWRAAAKNDFDKMMKGMK